MRALSLILLCLFIASCSQQTKSKKDLKASEVVISPMGIEDDLIVGKHQLEDAKELLGEAKKAEDFSGKKMRYEFDNSVFVEVDSNQTIIQISAGKGFKGKSKHGIEIGDKLKKVMKKAEEVNYIPVYPDRTRPEYHYYFLEADGIIYHPENKNWKESPSKEDILMEKVIAFHI